jgi:hypothetical protein
MTRQEPGGLEGSHEESFTVGGRCYGSESPAFDPLIPPEGRWRGSPRVLPEGVSLAGNAHRFVPVVVNFKMRLTA